MVLVRFEGGKLENFDNNEIMQHIRRSLINQEECVLLSLQVYY